MRSSLLMVLVVVVAMGVSASTGSSTADAAFVEAGISNSSADEVLEARRLKPRHLRVLTRIRSNRGAAVRGLPRRARIALQRRGHSATAAEAGITMADITSSQARRCRASDVRRGRAWFGKGPLMFAVGQAKTWCWAHRRVFNVRVVTYPVTKPSFFMRNLNERNYWAGSGRYTHITHSNGTFEWCPLQVGCTGQWHPWIQSFANGNGSRGLRMGG